ncbi:hypothetical protein [Streptomyces fagopyri]|uniref:hypothetical protein n=1 Tax=Streptomyces fagopyri TaxID=2662397 RepID=UPI0038218A8F
MTLVDAALTALHEYEGTAGERATEEFVAARKQFLEDARECASERLSEAAAALDWQYTPAAGLPEQMEQATALLEPGRLEYLRYRLDMSADQEFFELVRPCNGCGRNQVDPLGSLVDLGRLLTDGRSE